MEKPSLDQVRVVINALYNEPNTENKEQASQWLGQLQTSAYAWEIADQLLMLNVNTETSYFAAQTMRTKIQYHFHELQPVQYQSLKDSLLHYLSTLHTLSHAIVTQLCLALADLAMQMPQWSNVVQDLVQRFGNKLESLPILLELLTVLPEEVGSHHLRVGANRREEVLTELRKSSSIVFQIMTACLEKCPDEKSRIKLFHCAGSWITLGSFDPVEMANSKLLSTTFQTLVQVPASDTLHEVAADFICNALYTAEHLEKQLPLAEGLFKYVMTLPPALEAVVNEDDFDRALNLCRVFTEMGESFLEVIVSTPGEGLGDLRTLSMLLACVEYHQYEVAEVTFNFWYRLSEALFKENNNSKTDLFKPYIDQLFSALLKHCQMEPDFPGVPSDNDDFSDFRSRVTDLIKDCVFIVGSSNCFMKMYETIVQQANNMPWQVTEAVLFIMSTVAKNVSPDCEVVSRFLPMIFNLPSNSHISVQYTAIFLTGELAEWIEHHPDFLDPAVQFLLSNIQLPKLSSVSATALETLCLTCHRQMARHFDVLAQVVIAVDSLSVTSDACFGLIKGIGKVMEALPDDKVTEGLRQLCHPQTIALNQVLSAPKTSHPDPTLWLDRLAALFRFTNPTVINGKHHPCQTVIEEIVGESVIKCLRGFNSAYVLHVCQNPHHVYYYHSVVHACNTCRDLPFFNFHAASSCLDGTQQLVWPILSNVCNRYQGDNKVIERCCRCIRFAVRCIGKSAVNLLSPLVTQMVTMYNSNHHSCWLYLASILVDEYGDEEGCVPGLLEMAKAMSMPTFQLLSGQEGLVEHPDTVDDLYRLYTRCIQKFPVPFLRCELFVPIIQCAIAASTLEHRDANGSVMRFLRELVRTGLEKRGEDSYQTRFALVKQLLLEHGCDIVGGLVKACAGALPSYMIVEVADVIHELLTFCRQETSQWVGKSLQTLPTQTVTGAVIATPRQLQEFQHSLAMAQDPKAVWRSAREFSRLFR